MSIKVSFSRRRRARIAAVQALYQLDFSENQTNSVDEILGDPKWLEFLQESIRENTAATKLVKFDRDLFNTIVSGCIDEMVLINKMLDESLAPNHSLSRLEVVLRAILRAGLAELYQTSSNVPARIVIDEYVTITHAFYEGREPGLVNAVLDRLARLLVPDLMSNKVLPLMVTSTIHPQAEQTETIILN